MNHNLLDKIIEGDENKLLTLVTTGSVSLSLVTPPKIENNDHFSKWLNTFLSTISNITNPGGVCCMIVTDDMNIQNNTMNMQKTKEFFKHIQSQENKDWKLEEEIIWVKSPKESVEELNQIENGIIVDFSQTPFSTIYILRKQNSKTESVSRTERIKSLKISDTKKDEMLETIWFSQPSKENDFQDFSTKEITGRLVMLYSKIGDLVLDPFSGAGLTAIVATNLKRHYLCLDSVAKNVADAKKRLENNLSFKTN